MQKRSKSVPGNKVIGWWITSCPVVIGEFYLREVCALISYRTAHLSSNFSADSIIRNINRTGTMLLPFLKPTLKLIDVSILPMMSWTTLLSYTRLIIEHSLGRAQYFTNMAMYNAWLDVSNISVRSENNTYVGRLWSCCRFSTVFIVNMPS